MNLHFRGIEVPPLGSIRDIIFRKYLLREVKAEAKSKLLTLLNVIGSPTIAEAGQRAAWDRQARKVYEDYITLLCGEEVSESELEEESLKAFYEAHIKNSRPVLSGSNRGNGSLRVTGLPGIYAEGIRSPGHPDRDAPHPLKEALEEERAQKLKNKKPNPATRSG